MQQMAAAYLDIAEQIVRDAHSVTFGLNLSDTGVSTSALATFESDSEWGKLAAQVHNTNGPLMSGLPEATYLAVGGDCGE